MRILLLATLSIALASCAGRTQPPVSQVEKIHSFPVALNRDFQLRKVGQYFLDPAPSRKAQGNLALLAASISFEPGYRQYGAVTGLDQHQRFGNYYSIYWRARRRADVRLRFEYRQEKLHSFVLAREVNYPNARGSYETRIAVIGDDFFDDGRVIAWRVSLIVDGQIVASRRSYLWE